MNARDFWLVFTLALVAAYAVFVVWTFAATIVSMIWKRWRS